MSGARWGILALGAVFLLTGCPREDVEEVWEDPEDVLDWETEPAPGDEQTVSLGEVNESGVTGEASLTALNGEVEVMLEVDGAPADASLAAHIHTGRCDAPGGVVEGLDEVATDADGHGMSATTVSLRLADLRDGNHLVQVHDPDGTPAACGDIPEGGNW